MKVDSPTIWGYAMLLNENQRVEWVYLGTIRGCEGVDSHMQLVLVRAAGSREVEFALDPRKRA